MSGRSEMLQLSELLNDPLADPINIATEITAATTAALCVVSVISGEGIPPVKKKRVEEEKSTTFHLLSDPEFVNRFRMKRSTVNDLCLLLAPHIGNRYLTEKKILATLWLLGNQESFQEVAERFEIGESAVHTFLMNVCGALTLVMREIITWPQKHQLEQVANDFMNKTGFPGVVGVIGGTQIGIPVPTKFVDDYKNRDNITSMQLQAVCDSNLQFMDITTGWPGSVHNARVFRNSPLQALLQKGNLPYLYHIIGDETYPLTSYLIVPYEDKEDLTDVQKTFNACHAFTQCTIERAFELLKHKFRRLKYLDMELVEKVPEIIAATCVLHNYILKVEGYDSSVDVNPKNRNASSLHFTNIYAKEVQQKRNELAKTIAHSGSTFVK
nr:protein ALP1-like [Penaeus vannamei]